MSIADNGSFHRNCNHLYCSEIGEYSLLCVSSRRVDDTACSYRPVLVFSRTEQNYEWSHRANSGICDDEGDLYKLFHEVNSLVAILNAHAENEGRDKTFMKNTISDISHQLKTPLAALNIYNGLIQQEVSDNPELRKFASLSEQELDRIENLVQNLLKITKLDAGTITLEKSIQYVADMMEYVKRHFSYQAQQQEKTLILSGDDEITLFCDQTWLIEAVSNLVKNAIDHTKAGATRG